MSGVATNHKHCSYEHDGHFHVALLTLLVTCRHLQWNHFAHESHAIMRSP